MKKTIILLVMVFVVLSLKAQMVLTIPSDYARTDPINDSITKNWAGQLISFDDDDETTISFYITSAWKPENTILNTLASNGCDTENWPLYFRVVDSTFFEEQVSSLVGVESRTIEGRYTSNYLKWKNFLDVSHEMYWNSYNGSFVVLAAKDDGSLMKLSEVVTIRGDYTQITGYYTISGKAGITQSNLYKRTDYNTWTVVTAL